MQGSKWPPKLFLRKADLQDLNWNGAEGDVHVTNSPTSYFITGTETYVPESLLTEQRERLLAEVARLREALDKIASGNEQTEAGLSRWSRVDMIAIAQAARAAPEGERGEGIGE